MKKIISFDLSSGDRGIKVSLPAANQFLQKNPEYRIIAFLYQKEQITSYVHPNIEIRVCDQKIEQDDSPLQIKRKNNSTLIEAIKAVKNKEADFMVTAAASGPLVIAGYLISKPIVEKLKPAFAPIALDEDFKPKILLDAGANLDANSDTLLSYARMGSEYIKALEINPNPRVRLLNIGTEEQKGNELMRETYQKLMNAKDINFLGNLEATEVLSNKDDIVLADAISGNIALKSYEGAFTLVYKNLKKNAQESKIFKLQIAMMPKFRKVMRKIISADEVGGALILGLNDLLIKAHGGSNTKYLLNSLNLGKKLVEKDLILKIRKVLNGN